MDRDGTVQTSFICINSFICVCSYSARLRQMSATLRDVNDCAPEDGGFSLIAGLRGQPTIVHYTEVQGSADA